MLVNVWSFSGNALGFLWYYAVPVSFVMLTSPQYNFTCTKTCDYPGDKSDKHHNILQRVLGAQLPQGSSLSLSVHHCASAAMGLTHCASAAVGFTLLWSCSDRKNSLR